MRLEAKSHEKFRFMGFVVPLSLPMDAPENLSVDVNVYRTARLHFLPDNVVIDVNGSVAIARFVRRAESALPIFFRFASYTRL